MVKITLRGFAGVKLNTGLELCGITGPKGGEGSLNVGSGTGLGFPGTIASSSLNLS